MQLPRGSLDGSDEPPTGAHAPSFGEVPLPDFARRRTRVTFGNVEPATPSSSLASSDSSGNSAGRVSGSSVEGGAESEVRGVSGRAEDPGATMVGWMSPESDPWVDRDPWRVHVMAENWSDASSARSSDAAVDAWENWSGSAQSWSGWSSGNWSVRSGRDAWGNWDWRSDASASSDRNSNWSWRDGELSVGHRQRSGEPEDSDQKEFPGENGSGQGESHRLAVKEAQGHGVEMKPWDPASPGGMAKDSVNRPSGDIPSGVPSVAGNSQQNMSTGGKISSTYPPIFYARPGESWEQYWRSVMFWLASEGRSLPEEMRGPRLMQQLRERAGKIVQHLTVAEVSSAHGIDIIKKTMERSPIIKLLDQKRVDQRRQKFMRLARLPQESLESFINRAEIYRRENQSSPAYQVGSQFYVGHLMDAAKLTKRDQALIKAACGGALEDEDLVTNAIIDLADQLEGIPGCPIGRGEPTLDQEDKYLVQKAGVASTTSLSSASTTSGGGGPRRRRKKFFGRRKFRDAIDGNPGR